MDTRKIQQTGDSTFTVSLLKKWVNENNLRAGSKVDLYTNIDGSLIIKKTRKEESAIKAEVKMDEIADEITEENIIRTIYSLYTAGFKYFSLISVDGFTKEQRKTVIETTNKLIGVEIYKEKDSKFIIKSLLDSSDISIRQTLIQLKFITFSMHKDAISSLVENKIKKDKIEEREEEADRLFAMINRHFKRSLILLEELENLKINRPTLFEYFITARYLERIADHSEKIMSVSNKLRGNISSETKNEIESIGKISRGIVDDSINVIIEDSNTKVAYRALDNRDEVIEKIEGLEQELYKNRNTENYLVSIVLDSLKRTSEYGGNIAETAIQASIRKRNIK